VVPRVGGKVPTAAEETAAVKLVAADTVESVLPAGAGGHVFIRVRLPPPPPVSPAASSAMTSTHNGTSRQSVATHAHLHRHEAHFFASQALRR